MQEKMTIHPNLELTYQAQCDCCEKETEVYVIWEKKLCLFCISLAVDILFREVGENKQTLIH